MSQEKTPQISDLQGGRGTADYTPFIPASLAKLPRWLVWRAEYEADEPKPRKVPFYVSGKKRSGASGSPEDVANLAALDAAQAVLSSYTGLAFAFIECDRVIGIDLDGTIDASTGEENRFHREIINRLGSYTERSPSGTGYHVLLRLADGEVWQGNINAARTDDGVEMYAGKRYFTFTGQREGDADDLRTVTEADLQFIRERVATIRGKSQRQPSLQVESVATVSPTDGAAYQQRVRAVIDTICQSIATCPSGARNETANREIISAFRLAIGARIDLHEVEGKLADACRACGFADDEIASLLRDNPSGAKALALSSGGRLLRDKDDYSADRQKRREQNRQIQNLSKGFLPPKALTLEQMIDRCYWVIEGEQVAYVEQDRTAIMSFKEFKSMTACSWTEVENADGKRVPRPTADVWRGDYGRREVMTRTFRAGAPIECQSVDGMAAINTWRPIARWPARCSVSPFIEHVAYLFADATEREAFLDWLAHIEQAPGVLPHYGWLHIADNTGTGRNWLASLLSRVFRGYVAPGVDLHNLLESQFNGQLSERVLAIVDEIQESGGDQYRHANRFKSLINEETRAINPKYGRQYREHNSCRWLIFSNHANALPLSDNDRRIRAVMHNAPPKSADYYGQLYAALDDDEFVNSVGVWLSERDISRFNPGERPPMSAAKKSVIDAAKSLTRLAADDLIRDWPADVIATDDIARELSGDGNLIAKFDAGQRRALEDAGAIALGDSKRIKISGKPKRLYVLRNHQQWIEADNASLRNEVLRAGASSCQ